MLEESHKTNRHKINLLYMFSYLRPQLLFVSLSKHCGLLGLSGGGNENKETKYIYIYIYIYVCVCVCMWTIVRF